MEIIENVPNKISSATKVHPRRAAIALHFMYCCINMTYCYDYRCYCGMDYPVTALRDRCNCRKKCTGDKKKICGGGKYMSLYRTCETCSSSLDSSLLSSSSFKFYIVISGLVYHLSSSTEQIALCFRRLRNLLITARYASLVPSFIMLSLITFTPEQRFPDS